MAFDPSQPVLHAALTSDLFRNQFNALKALIDELQTRLDALPGRGTDAFVSAAGNDATAAIGDPARPFRTAQAAFDAARGLPGDRVLRFGAGDFGGITLAADWPERIQLAGVGATVTRLGGIMARGASGEAGANETSESPAGYGGNAGNGWTVRLASDGQIDLGVIDASGGVGGNPGQNLDGTYAPNSAGFGGSGGTVELTGCVLGAVFANGERAGLPFPNIAAGTGGTVTLVDCTVAVITANGGIAGGYHGAGGTVTLTRCLYLNVDVNYGGTFNDTPTAPGSGVSSNVVRG